MDNQNVRLVASFVIGVLVGVIAYAIVDNANEADKPIPLDSFTATTTTPVIEGDNGVSVQNQSAGSRVEVENIVLEKAGWVAIHDNLDGTPGRVLGARFFDAGKTSGSIGLLRKTVAGTSYLVVLHTDDGNSEDFNPRTDTIMTQSDGKPIMTSFTAGEVASTSQVLSPLINLQTIKE